jgi:hypothetical protein
MACVKCSFYQPKDSISPALLEGKNNLLRMRQEIPLGESEIAGLDDGISALESEAALRMFRLPPVLLHSRFTTNLLCRFKKRGVMTEQKRRGPGYTGAP